MVCGASISVYSKYVKPPFPAEQNAIYIPVLTGCNNLFSKSTYSEHYSSDLEQNPVSIPAPPLFRLRNHSPSCKETLPHSSARKNFWKIIVDAEAAYSLGSSAQSRKYPPNKHTFYVPTESQEDKILPSSITMPSQSSKTPSERSMISGSGSRYALTLTQYSETDIYPCAEILIPILPRNPRAISNTTYIQPRPL
jgi:hypothetical protein